MKGTMLYDGDQLEQNIAVRQNKQLNQLHSCGPDTTLKTVKKFLQDRVCINNRGQTSNI